jgi:hypothetical protein
MTVRLLGFKGNESKEIVKHELLVSKARSNDFTVAFKRPTSDFDKLKVTFEV